MILQQCEWKILIASYAVSVYRNVVLTFCLKPATEQNLHVTQGPTPPHNATPIVVS